jgi:hypothetical protein
MYEYKRIKDTGHGYDSLEKLCTEEAKDGWRVISISDGDMYRYATLEKEAKQYKHSDIAPMVEELKEKLLKPKATKTNK